MLIGPSGRWVLLLCIWIWLIHWRQVYLSVQTVGYSLLLVLGHSCHTTRSRSRDFGLNVFMYLWLCPCGMFFVATCHIHRTGLPPVVDWLPDCNWDKFTFHSKWIMLSCRISILSRKGLTKPVLSKRKRLDLLYWLYTFLFHNTLACVCFFTLWTVIKLSIRQ